MMYNYGYGHEVSALGFVWHGIGFVILVAFVVWLLRMITGRGRHGRHLCGAWHAHSGLEILNERYAKGEITKEEYEERKKTLLG
jgi:putative membrane protein